jgi:protein SCO1/2
MNRSIPFRTLLAAVAFAAAAGFARAEVPLIADKTPKDLEGVGITEHLNETIPLDLAFKDENGADVKLRDYFTPGKPVILTLNYYNCKMLCNLTLNGMVDGLNGVEWSAGKEFQIVTVSINPAERPELAHAKKSAYLTQYKRDSVKGGWHFLTGDQANIDALCEATGFGYKPVDNGDFAHTATIMFLTPDGKISRYMNNVMFEPRDLKFALIEASQGAIGSPMDKFLLLMCFHYDPLRNSYAASAMKIMRLGGMVTLVLLLTGLGMLWWRGPRKGATAATDQAPIGSANSEHHVVSDNVGVWSEARASAAEVRS